MFLLVLLLNLYVLSKIWNVQVVLFETSYFETVLFYIFTFYDIKNFSIKNYLICSTDFELMKYLNK